MVDSNSRQDKSPNKGDSPFENFSMGSSQQMQIFEDELKDIYWAENAFVKALPLMIENNPTSKLIGDLTSHLAETKIQVARLEDVFLSFGKTAAAKKCKAIVILIKESEAIIKEAEKNPENNLLTSDTIKKTEESELDPFDTLSQYMETRVFMNMTSLESDVKDENQLIENFTNEDKSNRAFQSKKDNSKAKG